MLRVDVQSFRLMPETVGALLHQHQDLAQQPGGFRQAIVDRDQLFRFGECPADLLIG